MPTCIICEDSGAGLYKAEQVCDAAQTQNG